MHAFMAAILLRMARLDALDGNAEAQPPNGESAQVEKTIGTGKGHAVVGTDGLQQTAFLKQALKSDKGALFLDGLAEQKVAAGIIGNGQRVLESGIDIEQTDDFGHTALRTAVECSNDECVDILLKAGANVDQASKTGTALGCAGTRSMAVKLLEAGADPQELNGEGQRAILGFPPEPNLDLLDISADLFEQGRSRRCGTRNPEMMNNPFWEAMIRSGVNAYQAGNLFGIDNKFDGKYMPIWCAQRFGQSLTFLPDGRIVQVAGKHEDHYDPDFCIYNDVFVHSPDGSVTIYGYPESVFAPTDFHTATLIGDFIYLIGPLGYPKDRRYWETSVAWIQRRFR
jgi:hypothetical protein